MLNISSINKIINKYTTKSLLMLSCLGLAIVTSSTIIPTYALEDKESTQLDRVYLTETKEQLKETLEEKEKEKRKLEAELLKNDNALWKNAITKTQNEFQEDIKSQNRLDELSDYIEKSAQYALVKTEIDLIKAQLESTLDNLEKVDKEDMCFLFPARGVYTSMYGWRISPFGENRIEWHTGVDIAGEGDIRSVLDGTVVKIDFEKDGYGNYLDVEHTKKVNGKTIRTRYAHLKHIDVKMGERVAKGEKLGVMGTTGKSTGRHLHFEVLENNKRVDPYPYLKQSIKKWK